MPWAVSFLSSGVDANGCPDFQFAPWHAQEEREAKQRGHSMGGKFRKDLVGAFLLPVIVAVTSGCDTASSKSNAQVDASNKEIGRAHV